MRFAFFNKDGRVDTAINDDAITTLPDGAVELTEGQFSSRFDLLLVDKILTVSPVVIPREIIVSRSWEAIKAERDRRKAAGVKVGTKWFHSDDASRIQQMALTMMGASIPANLQWKTMGGSFVTMTQTLASQIFQASAANDMAIFSAAETHKAAMEASEDPSTYDFSTGWPAIFQG
jgi:hypothetical protein